MYGVRLEVVRTNLGLTQIWHPQASSHSRCLSPTAYLLLPISRCLCHAAFVTLCSWCFLLVLLTDSLVAGRAGRILGSVEQADRSKSRYVAVQMARQRAQDSIQQLGQVRRWRTHLVARQVAAACAVCIVCCMVCFIMLCCASHRHAEGSRVQASRASDGSD